MAGLSQPDFSLSAALATKKEVDSSAPIENPRECILKLLQQAQTSGTFATAGDCCPEMTMPGLFIKGIGQVGLPVSETTSSALLEKCREYKGAKAVDPHECSLQNPIWERSIQNLATQVYDKLGVPKEVGAQAILDKLFVLEAGSGFPILSQCNIEKDKVFGTLIIVLPCNCEGGNIIVKHGGNHKTVLSPSSPYKAQYAASYNDCTLNCHPQTKGTRLCLVYKLVQSNIGPPLPTASDNDRFALIEQLRDAATAWNANFDGNKLVIMTDYLRHGSFQGDEKAVVQLLRLAVKEGVDLAWSRGTVKYRIYGYGYGPQWMGYEWGDLDGSKMTLNLRKFHEWNDGVNGMNDEPEEFKGEEVSDSEDSDEGDDDCDDYDDEFCEDYDDGDVTLDAATEMIPTNFYDNKTYDERFETTFHGVNGKRKYDNEGAIVLWPKSSSWRVLTKDDLGEMCRFLLRDPDALKVVVLADLIVAAEFKGYGSSRKSVVASFM